MNKHYLDIDFATSNFYEYSKVEKEGFDEHTNSKGTVSYKKLFKKGVFGVLQNVSIVDSTNQGKKLVVRLLDGEDIYMAGIQLYNQRGQFDHRYIEPLITLLPNMEKEQTYRLFPWAMEREDKPELKNYGVSMKLANLDDYTVSDKVERAFTKKKKADKFDKKIHLPELVFEEEMGSWKPTLVSVDIKQKFLVGILEKAFETIGYVANTQPQGNAVKKDMPKATAQEAFEAPATTVKPQAKAVADIDEDDIPF